VSESGHGYDRLDLVEEKRGGKVTDGSTRSSHARFV
jgi:hypothetical protein